MATLGDFPDGGLVWVQEPWPYEATAPSHKFDTAIVQGGGNTSNIAIGDAGLNSGGGAFSVYISQNLYDIDQVTDSAKLTHLGTDISAPIGALTVAPNGDIYYASLTYSSIGGGQDTVAKMDQQGTATTFHPQFADPSHGCTYLRGYLARDDAGYFYASDPDEHRLCKFDPNLTSETVLAGNGDAGFQDGTGGPTGTAEFMRPEGVAVDANGNVIVADEYAIRAIDSSGNVTTLAGGNAGGYADGPASSALFQYLYGLTIDAAGEIYVVDEGNFCIRRFDPVSKTVTTVAGNGNDGNHDGTLGRSGTTTMEAFGGLAAGPDGTVFFLDLYNDPLSRTSGEQLLRRIYP